MSRLEVKGKVCAHMFMHSRGCRCELGTNPSRWGSVSCGGCEITV